MATIPGPNMLQLPAASGLDGTENAWVVQGGVDKYTTVAAIANTAMPLTVGKYSVSGSIFVKQTGFKDSVTKNGTGDFTFMLLSATIDTGNAVIVTLDGGGAAMFATASVPSTTTARVLCFNTSGVKVDPAYIMLAIYAFN